MLNEYKSLGINQFKPFPITAIILWTHCNLDRKQSKNLNPMEENPKAKISAPLLPEDNFKGNLIHQIFNLKQIKKLGEWTQGALRNH